MTTPDMVKVQFTAGKKREAEAIAARLGQTLELRGLENTINDWMVVYDEAAGQQWLICAHNMKVMGRLEAYQTPEVLHHLSTAIGGRKVFAANHQGLWYFVPLSAVRPLPPKVDFPGIQRGYVLLGQGYTGQPVRATWKGAGHMLVGGMTGSGKSHFLRLLAYQALAEGLELFLADRDGTTFPMLAQHPQLTAPIARTPAEVLTLVEQALGECDHRSTLYEQLGTFPDNLDEYNADARKAGLPCLLRRLMVMEEFNATVLEAGGAKGPLASAASELGWRGRKFGLNLVFAAQDFTKDIVGRVRDQVSTVICFRVRNADIARVVGCPDAAKMTRTRPGLAYTDRWQYIQAYYLPKAALIEAGQTTPPPMLTPAEQDIVQRALAEAEGRMSLSLLQGWGWTEWQSRKLLNEWELRGWVHKDPARDNARYITPKLQVLLSNHLTPQPASSHPSVSQAISSCTQTAKENY